MRDQSLPEARSRGFTLVEMLVALALMSIAVLAASALIVESIRLLDHTGRSLRDPSFEVASGHLRRDVHAAASLGQLAAHWSTVPLELRLHDGNSIRIHSHAGTLVRRELDHSGDELSRRVLLGRLARWRWRSLTPTLLEVEITLSRHPDPWHSARDWAPGQPVEEVETTETLFLALRGRRRGRSW